MNQATLIVSRVGDHELRFVLQRTEAARPPVVMQDSTALRPDQRKQIHNALQDFAECVSGHHADEPKFAEVGRILYGMLLPRSIRAELRELKEPLVILTDDPSLPWEVLHDDTEFLSLRLALARQLLIHRQIAGLLRPPDVATKDFSALVIADPLGDLPGARAEGEALAKLLGTRGPSELMMGADVTWDGILRRLVRKPYSIIHYCGHMEYEPSERLSSIPIKGGGRLAADDIASSFRGSPVVFLNSCSSDGRNETPSSAASAESLARTESFARAFMLGNENGVASTVVGTMWRVPDEPIEAGRELAKSFYNTLFSGGPVGEAMRTGRLLAREKRWGPMVWGPYVLYGDPLLCPFPKPPEPETTTKAAGETIPGTKSVPVPARDIKRPIPPQPRTPIVDPEPAPQLAEAGPLDDPGRKVFREALKAMATFGHQSMSSIHLLIGLCAAAPKALETVLDDADLEISCISGRARRRAKKHPPEANAVGGISVTVVKALTHAVVRAKQMGRSKITGDDLLAGLLRYPQSEGVQIIQSFGVTPERVLERLNASTAIPPVPNLDSVLAAWQLDPSARKAIETGVEIALKARLDFLGTPHLLIGLLRAKRIADAFRRVGIDPDQLCVALLECIGEMPPETLVKGLTLRPRSKDILNAAKALAGGTIGEIQLLEAILNEKEGAAADVLNALDVDAARILSSVR